jgi:hypothetical protein
MADKLGIWQNRLTKEFDSLAEKLPPTITQQVNPIGFIIYLRELYYIQMIMNPVILLRYPPTLRTFISTSTSHTYRETNKIIRSRATCHRPRRWTLRRGSAGRPFA